VASELAVASLQALLPMSNCEKEDPTALAGSPENRKATIKAALNVSDDDLSEDEYKRLLWKIDRNIIPYVSL
jgi:hypothetical protein